MADVTTYDKETIESTRTRRCMYVGVPYPLNTKLIYRLAVLKHRTYLVHRNVVALVSLVLLTS